MISTFESNILPKTWKLCRFDEFLKRIERKFILDDTNTYKCVGVRWYGKGAFVREELLGINITRKQQWIVRSGDVLYNKLFAWKGAFSIADSTVDNCIVSDKFPTYRIDTDIADPGFLSYFFLTSQIAEQALALSKGGAAISKLTLNPPQFWDLTIPLPPLEEQRRIVARIEEVAAKIEEARGLRREAMEEVKSILFVTSKHFFTTDNSNSKMAQLQEVTHRITKGESPEWQGFTYQEAGPLFVRSENVLWGNFDLSKRTYIPVEFHQKLNRSQLRSGDVLINLVGASIGRACVFPSNIGEANINQAVAVISPDSEKLNSRYLLHFLLSAVAQEILHSGKVETARPNISLSNLRNLTLPILPLSEQQYIVSYLDNLQSKLDALKHVQAETSAELNALFPSILDKAFKGEL